MNSEDFKEFIDTSEDISTGIKGKRLSFVGSIPYNELNYSPGSAGYHQAMDRVEFMIENWHSFVCSHPVFRNPDSEMDTVRKNLVNAAHTLFEVYNELGSVQLKKDFNLATDSSNKAGVH